VQADEGFSYDSVGNRLTAEGVTGDWSYNENNELQGYDDVAFEYDANGNMTKKTDAGQVTNYIYNVEDRLERVENGSGSLISTYYYDPFGRRLWKEVGGVKIYFVYADEGLVAEVDAAGNVTKSYGYKPGSTWTTDPLFMQVGGQYYFYQNDHLGTPQKLTAVNGAVVWSAMYSSFGQAEVGLSSTVTNNLRFPGQYHDEEINFHYNWHRYYDYSIGRYLRVDPSHSLQPKGNNILYLLPALIYMPQELNKYCYAKSNSLKYADHLGLMSGKPKSHPGVPSPTGWIADQILVEGIGGLYAGLCVEAFCQRKVRPSSLNSTGAECFRVMNKHNLPSGHVYDSTAFYTVCQEECYRITQTKEFEEACDCPKKSEKN
jgi:RHS repeat-associated protein